MIQSTSSSDRTIRPDALPTAGQPTTRAKTQPSDQLSTENANLLASSLARTPEIRPEVVARAKSLAADPAYPSRDVMKSVAQQILAAPDLSEDES
jgi:hypothetical protein